MKVGFGISEDLPIRAQQDVARSVEAAGLASLWTNEAMGRDALLLCQAWAAVTDRIEVGVSVVPIWTRSPAQMAMGAATLQEFSGGRFILGLGVSHPATMGSRHGVEYRKPLSAVRDLLEIFAQINHDGSADVEGTVLQCRDFKLRMTPQPPPIRRYVGAMGPKMLDLSARAADGVLLNWSDVGEVARAVTAVRTASSAAGRPPGSVEVAGYVRVAVGPTRESAQIALAAQIGQYARLPSYAAHFVRQGHGAALERSKAAHKAGADAAGLAEALGESTLSALGWAGGSEDDLSGMITDYADAGMDHLIARVVVADDDPLDSVGRTIECLGRVAVPS